MDEKERMDKAVCITVLAVILLAAAFSWYYIAGRNDVHDIRERADETRSELESAREEQRDQAESLDRAENAADRSQSAIRDSEERADRVEELERSDAEIIRENEQIFANIRNRGKTENQG